MSDSTSNLRTMKEIRVPLIVSLLLIHAPLAGAVTLIQDSFDTLELDESLNGRAPDISLAGGTWLTNSTNLRGNGTGGVKGFYNFSRNISIDLGAGYFTTNPGVYQLSMSLKSHEADSNSWVGIGFSEDAVDSSSLSTTDNAARAWVAMRQSGSVSVYAGPGATNPLTSGTGLPAVSTSNTEIHTYTVVLDTSLPDWTFQVLLDGAAIDLGSTGNKTHTFDGGLADLRYLMIGASQGGVTSPSGIATIDDFSFTGPTPVPEPATAIMIALSGISCFLRKRRD